METIIDYIDSNQLTITSKNFNSIDALIFCTFAYLNFDDMIWYKSFSIKNILINMTQDSLLKHTFLLKHNKLLVEKLLSSKRFRNIRVDYYINEIDHKNHKQFCAMTFIINHELKFICFKGTDTILTSWRENFKLAYQKSIPSQNRAKLYLEKMSLVYPTSHFIIGGHSKGGNLAIYASMMCKKKVVEKIISVYDFDGPGFKKDIYISKKYQKIQEKIIKYLPTNTVVGAFLELPQNYKVIKSKQFGVMQHDPFSWKIKDNDFIESKISRSSLALNLAINKWLSENEKESKKIINYVFLIFEKMEITDFFEIDKVNIRLIIKFIKSARLVDMDSKKTVSKAIISIYFLAAKIYINPKLKGLE